ncbi:MAG: FlaD/FlaE family flagellar protein [Halobacteriaceae archaeon]
MTINPRDYDPSELEGMLDEGDPSELQNGGGEFEWASPPSTDALESNQYRQLFMLQSAAGDVGKPYLEELPGDYGAELVVFEWLDFLLTKAGVRSALEALRYYESIGWLGEDAEETLEEYLLGLDEPEDAVAGLDREDHSLSLVYVARLAAMG